MVFKHPRLVAITAVTIALSIIIMATQNQLTLYIHPRYELFTVVMAAIGLLLFLMPQRSPLHSSEKKTTFILCLLVLCFMFLPPASLTPQTAQNRLQSSVVAQAQRTSSYDSYTRDYTHFDIQDWSTFFANAPAANQVVGKRALIEGFVLRDGQSLFIARFRLSCCAVDATPLTIQLAPNEKTSNLLSGSWYRFSGDFIEQNADYLLSADEVTQIPEPKEPYVF